MDERHYVRQLGGYKFCARNRCKDAPHFRVILGSFRIQAYVCSAHVLWGIELDRLTQRNGESMGWEYGYGSTPNFRTIQTPRVVSLATKEFDYTRNEAENISAMFPTITGEWS
jgi:hypothetical protein